MRISRYAIKRIVSIIPVLIGASVLVFMLIHMAPGDPALTIGGMYMSEDGLAQLRKNLRLDLPLYQQYFMWIKDLVSGNFGISAVNQRPVLDIILNSFPVTLLLAVSAFCVSLIIGIPAGVIAAYKHNSLYDQIIRGLSIGGVSMPRFWLALIFIWFAGIQFRILPPGGYTPITENFIEGLRSIILPVMTLAMAPMSRIARVTRASMLDILNTDYIRTARGKGLKEPTILLRHALRNALITVLTLVGMEIAYLLAGAAIVETVFFIPGTARMLINSVHARDYQVVQGIVLFITFIFVISNLVVDLLYHRINPKIRF